MRRIELLLVVGLIAGMALRWWPSSSRATPVEALSLSRSVDGAVESTALGFISGQTPATQKLDTLVVFTDFYCPFCKRLGYVLDSVSLKAGFHLMVRHWPLTSIHPAAFDAAIAFECGALQVGAKPMHDALFHNEALLDERAWLEIAQRAGEVRTEEFRSCLSAPKARGRVQRDLEFAEAQRFSGTPTLVFKGRLVRGDLSAASVLKLLSP